MSYILEALKRADAERQRGGVPGLHAQAGRGVMLAEPGHTHGRPWLLAFAAVALLLVGGAAAWWWDAGRGAPPGAVPIGPAAAVLMPSAPVVAAPTPAVVAMPPLNPAPNPAPVTATAAAAAAQALPVQPGVVAKVLPAARTTPPSAAAPPAAAPPRPVTTSASAAASVVVPSNTVPATTVPAAAAPPVRLPQLAELPEAQRREVGMLSPGGSIYAEQPAARMVILNGQVFREGDSLATDLRVEQIRPRSVVLSLRGQRFELPL